MISIRLAPGDDPARAITAVTGHLRARNTWGAEITVVPVNQGAPHQVDATGSASEAFRRASRQAWGCAPVEPGSGGSLPLVAALARAQPGAQLLLTGVCDPDSMAHSENESVHLADLSRCCEAEAALLGHLAALA
jgi:acetylornithine deacetylase/succinyl-diaminopimelate desuccinylase-like protein